MRKNLLFIGVLLISAGFLFILAPDNQVLAAECKVEVNFDAKPNPVPFNQDIVFSGWVKLSGFEPVGTSNAGFCLKNGKPVKELSIRIVTPGLKTGKGCAEGAVYLDNIKLEPSRGVAYGYSKAIKPSDCGAKNGQSIDAKAQIGGVTPDGAYFLVESSTIKVNLTAGLYTIYGCVADDGKFACSRGNLRDCSDVDNNACRGKTCGLIDSQLCGSLSTADMHMGCLGNVCVLVKGAGPAMCSSDTDCVGGGPGGGGTDGGGTGTGTGGGAPVTTRYVFNLRNPIEAENFQDLVNIIGRWIFNLAIPIAVIIIIYAGGIMLTSGGNPGRFQKGAKALWYAVLGLAVVLIGKGFVTLIQSILSLRNP